MSNVSVHSTTCIWAWFDSFLLAGMTCLSRAWLCRVLHSLLSAMWQTGFDVDSRGFFHSRELVIALLDTQWIISKAWLVSLFQEIIYFFLELFCLSRWLWWKSWLALFASCSIDSRRVPNQLRISIRLRANFNRLITAWRLNIRTRGRLVKILLHIRKFFGLFRWLIRDKMLERFWL